ncbi:MAG: choice-of-anchor H family protein [Gammaproteobacteria bacterium]|nr:choice-of-anchor H family protein [Gammaproteobacteria bacterium]
MNRATREITHRRRYLAMALGVALAASVDAAPEESGEDSVLRAAAGYTAERDPDALRDVGAHKVTRLAPDQRVTKPRSSSGGSEARTASASTLDHWIYDAAVELFFDADNDGYYRYLRVRFDVDSYYDPAWVYAMLWISADGDTWELYHETDDFRVDGAIPDDEYEVETELLANYPTGEYDVLVEIYDADTGEFAAEFGPAQSSAFALLPLEDADRDAVPPPVVIVEEGGGGAMSWLALPLLGAAVALRRRVARRRVTSYSDEAV